MPIGHGSDNFPGDQTVLPVGGCVSVSVRAPACTVATS